MKTFTEQDDDIFIYRIEIKAKRFISSDSFYNLFAIFSALMQLQRVAHEKQGSSKDKNIHFANAAAVAPKGVE